MNDLISVIVPIYKVEEYLEKCVNSILNQTYSNLEVLLIDDGSPDNCPQLCDDFAKKDIRIRVFHKKNGGLSSARNYGIEHAKGKYICFVDSDDFVSNDYIETLLKLIKKYNVSISIINYLMVDKETQIPTEKSQIYEKTFNRREAIEELFKSNGVRDYPWNKMYDASLFSNIKYPVNRKMEDMGTTYKIFAKVEKIAFSNQVGYYYLQRDNSILHSLNADFFNDKFYLANERFYFLKNIYSGIVENYIFMFQTCMECYPYLSENNSKECERTIGILMKEKSTFKKRINFKLRIKYFLYIIN